MKESPVRDTDTTRKSHTIGLDRILDSVKDDTSPDIAELFPTGHDWFSAAEARSDFDLSVAEPFHAPSPALQQLQQAWNYACAQGAVPLVNVFLERTESEFEGVEGTIESFYAVSEGDTADEIHAELTQIFGSAGDRLDHVAGVKALPADTRVAYFWEWLHAGAAVYRGDAWSLGRHILEAGSCNLPMNRKEGPRRHTG